MISLKVQLPILSFLDGLLEEVQIIFGRLSGFDQSLFDLVQIFSQVLLQVCIFVSDSDSSAEDGFGGEDGNMAMVVIAGTDDGIVEGLELFEDSVLVGQDGYP